MHFNSRPHGGRLDTSGIEAWVTEFQLTPSRRATDVSKIFSTPPEISTHALTEGDGFLHIPNFLLLISTHALTEGDVHHMNFPIRQPYFNSRPHGGRQNTTGNLV